MHSSYEKAKNLRKENDIQSSPVKPCCMILVSSSSSNLSASLVTAPPALVLPHTTACMSKQQSQAQESEAIQKLCDKELLRLYNSLLNGSICSPLKLQECKILPDVGIGAYFSSGQLMVLRTPLQVPLNTVTIVFECPTLVQDWVAVLIKTFLHLQHKQPGAKHRSGSTSARSAQASATSSPAAQTTEGAQQAGRLAVLQGRALPEHAASPDSRSGKGSQQT